MHDRKYEKEYLSLIEEFRAKLDEDNAQEILSMLDELFEIKPVRLLWYVVKAEAMLLAKYNVEEIYKLLDGKIAPPV